MIHVPVRHCTYVLVITVLVQGTGTVQYKQVQVQSLQVSLFEGSTKYRMKGAILPKLVLAMVLFPLPSSRRNIF